jgi:hypothetical protein
MRRNGPHHLGSEKLVENSCGLIVRKVLTYSPYFFRLFQMFFKLFQMTPTAATAITADKM